MSEIGDSIYYGMGFESEAEFNRMVCAVDLSAPHKIEAFKRWQNGDGTKAGLMELLTSQQG